MYAQLVSGMVETRPCAKGWHIAIPMGCAQRVLLGASRLHDTHLRPTLFSMEVADHFCIDALRESPETNGIYQDLL